MPSREITGLYSLRYYVLGPEITGSYAIRHVISREITGSVGVGPVVREFEGLIPNGVSTEITGLYGLSYTIESEHEGVYRIRNTTDVSREITGTIGQAPIANEIEGSYSIASLVQAEFEGEYRLATYVSAEFEGLTPILDYNYISREFSGVQQYVGALGGTIINRTPVDATSGVVIVTTVGDGNFVGTPVV